ncbi:MAG: hypothetical protein ACJA2M_001699 [Polaribacter sp.]|jgi:hypothetical protein
MIKGFKQVEKGIINLLIEWQHKLFGLEIEEFIIANHLNSN